MECDCFIFLQYGENTGFFLVFLVDGSIIAARYGLFPWSFKKENINHFYGKAFGNARRMEGIR